MWCAISNNIYMDSKFEFWLNMQLLTKMPLFTKFWFDILPILLFTIFGKKQMHPFFNIKFVAGKYLVFFFLENLLSNTRLEGRSSEEIRVHAVQTGPPFLKILNLLSLTLLSFYSCMYSSLFWFCFSAILDRHEWYWRRRPVRVYWWYRGGLR